MIVNTTADTDDGSCDPLGTGTGNQDCTLREAINVANATPGADAITFDPVVFAVTGPHFIDLLTATPGGPDTGLPIAGDLTITGPGANVLTVRRSAAGGTPTFRIFAVSPGVTASISGLTVSNGARANGSGILNDGTLTLSGVAVDGNQNNGNGGGIFNSGTITISGSTMSNNSGVFGSGIYNDSASGVMTIVNSTVSGNQAGDGGGVYNNNSIAIINNSTVTNNSSVLASSGAGIHNAGTLTLNNTIVAGNTQGVDLASSMFLGNGSGSFNLIGTCLLCGISNGVNSNQVGVANPLLGPLTNNGGPTKTHALLRGSPALDKGKNFGSATDQRGQTRPFDDPLTPNASGGDGSDIGAFESQTAIVAMVVNTTADTDDGACDPLGTGTGNQDCTLREAINVANATPGADAITFDPMVFAVTGPHLLIC